MIRIHKNIELRNITYINMQLSTLYRMIFIFTEKQIE